MAGFWKHLKVILVRADMNEQTGPESDLDQKGVICLELYS